MTQHTKEPVDWDNVPLIRARYTEMKSEITRLHQDRAELLTALEKIADYKGSEFEIGVARNTINCMKKVARATIAKATKQ